jgi:hypothetical protein
MKRLTTILATFALLLGGAPAYAAEEPVPGEVVDPCTAQVEPLEAEVAHWEAEVERVREIGWQREQAALSRAMAAEERVLTYAERLGARTQQRDRLLRINQRLTGQRYHMKATIARLRAKLRNEPVS